MAEPTDTSGAAAGGNVDDLVREAAQIEQGPNAAGPADPNAPPGAELVVLPEQMVQGNCEVILGALIAGRDGFTDFTQLQSVQQMLSDPVAGRHALMWAKVLAKRGVDLQKLQGKNGDLIMAAVMTGTLAWSIYQAASMEYAQRLRTVENTAGQPAGGESPVSAGPRPAGGHDQGGAELANIGAIG